MSISHNNSKSAGIFNLGQQNGAFLSILFMERHQFFQRIITYDIAIKHKEQPRFIIFLKNILS